MMIQCTTNTDNEDTYTTCSPLIRICNVIIRGDSDNLVTSVKRHVCVILRLSSGLRSVRLTSLVGWWARSEISSTKVTELPWGLRGSRGTELPSCCNIPIEVMRHSWERLPTSCTEDDNKGN